MNLVSRYTQRGLASLRSMQTMIVLALFALMTSPAFATTPVATIKAKIVSAGADWVEILIAVALIVWAAFGVKLLFGKK